MGSQRVGHDWATFTFTFTPRWTRARFIESSCVGSRSMPPPPNVSTLLVTFKDASDEGKNWGHNYGRTTKVHLVKAMVFPVVMYGCECWSIKKTQCRRIDVLNCGIGEDSWESLGLQGDPTSPSWRKSVLNIHGKDWRWSWNSNTLATWCKELTHWKRPWCWERLKVGGEGDDRGWDGWMASPTQWTWVWVNSRSRWWAGRPGVLQSMGSQRVGHDWVTELKWTELNYGRR